MRIQTVRGAEADAKPIEHDTWQRAPAARSGTSLAARGFELTPRLLTGLVLVTATLALTACGVGGKSGPSFGDQSSDWETKAAPWKPVNVPGVASCRAVADLTGSSAGPAEGGLQRLRLPCLTQGPAVDLSRVRGQLVLVNLWASWCGPCRKEMPVLQAAYERYGKQVQFVGVDTRDGPPAIDYLQEVDVTYPQLADVNGDLLKQLRIPGIPVTLILGSDGSIVDKHIGAFEGSDLEDLLARTIASSG